MAANNIQNTILCQAQSEKRTYSVGEIADMPQISKNRALCKQFAFRTAKIGKYVRISKTSFDNWLDNAD